MVKLGLFKGQRLTIARVDDAKKLAEGYPERIANLFAAAPDLLEALEFFLDGLDSRKRGGLAPAPDHSDWATVEYTARAAIRKAKGE